ncbi:MAG: hypothetical protein HYR70_07700 [Chloroflexi bacterium]|nr:hypothetical protein [Chloroflexota bacterium]MBI3341442.1 hypothetical protein [Chloroflexota bacterium]
MADTIKCPVCGEVNTADLEFCQNCQSRLQPFTGPLQGENAPLQPGQNPTKKVTSELEPILPQWLREARQQSRQTDGEEPRLAAQDTPTVPISSAPDLLAGLASQNDDDEDAPDWLLNITGNAPARKKKNEPEDSNVKWVEVGSPDDFSETPSEEIKTSPTTPTWMTPQESAPEKDELAAWLSQVEQSPASFADEKESPVPSVSSAPDVSSVIADKPDWLENLQAGISTIDNAPVGQPPVSGDETKDWLHSLDSGMTSLESPAQPAPVSSDETPDWLKNLGANSISFEQKPPEQPAPQNQPEPASDIPDWLRTFGEPRISSAPEGADSASNGMMPDWLKAAAPSGEKPPVDQPEPASDRSADMPSWLSSLKPIEAQQPQEPPARALTPDEAAAQKPFTAPAFAEDSLSSDDVDAIFGSLQMPDWLSSAAAPSQPPLTESPPPAAQSGESIAPAELPSWVQAMRPVESAPPNASSSELVDSAFETDGPLAGLQGVLPALPGGIKASSRPKSYSIKLNASEEQQAQSALLEQILAQETATIPMKSSSMILSQRVLRWVITALLFIFVGGILFARTEIFTLPGRIALPNDETEAALSVVDTIPEGVPVLAVFDYEPSLAGELEAVGAPLFNRLLLLKHPNLAIVSTSPTGPALAERFMSTTMAERGYQRGAQYVDLGYLAGGLAGVYDFAQNPATVLPLGADGTPVWQSALLQGKTRLSDFAAVIVLTDSVEAGRVWVEQAGPFRGNASFVVISSAQAGPLLMPYLQSGQINGLVAGLNSAAKIEQANGQPGLARRYWDAYSLGLLLAVAVMFLGGFWNFVIGLQVRRSQGAK